MDFSLFYNLLFEMPRAISDNVDLRDSSSRISEIEEMAPEGFIDQEPFDYFTLNKINIQVFNIGHSSKLVEFVFVRSDNDKIIAVFSGERTSDGGVETEFIETRRGEYKGSLMGLIYSKFLLNHFKYIMSDSMLSGKGQRFWMNNFVNWKRKGLNIVAYNIMDKTIYPVKNTDELQTYIGKSDRDAEYRFVLKKK